MKHMKHMKHGGRVMKGHSPEHYEEETPFIEHHSGKMPHEGSDVKDYKHHHEHVAEHMHGK